MNINTIIVLGAALACAFSGYVLWKSKQDGLSFIDEVKRQLDGHKSETVKATVAAVQAIQATPVAPTPVAPAVEPPKALYVPPIVPVSPIQAPISTFLGPQPAGTAPYVAPVRDEMAEGPKIAEWLSAHYPEMMPKVSRVIHWWATHSNSDYMGAMDAILANADLTGADYANAIGQQHRDDAAHVDGDLYNGPYPVGSLSQVDMFYLLRIKPAYAERTGRNVIIDVVYGSAEKVNELIQDAAEVHAPEMEAFNMDAYQGPLRPIVESRMNGK